MELHRSCVLPSNAPSLLETEQSIPSRVLRERSGNRRHGLQNVPRYWKRSASPTENLCHPSVAASYFACNLAAQLNGERSEEQVDREFKKVWNMVQRSEKWRKYREHQPTKQKDKEQIWSDELEYAFFKALVRWPPMGRRKLMLDGQLRGRNELVQISINRDTCIERDRKQVSSHLQVLRPMFKDDPFILMYMPQEDQKSKGKKKRLGSSHPDPQRNRHSPSLSSRYDYPQTVANAWTGYGSLPSSHVAAKMQSNPGFAAEAPFAVTDFAIILENMRKEPVHYFTQMAQAPRLGDLNVTDTGSWHKQYPELKFHRIDQWKDRQVLLCEASIKVMTDKPSFPAQLTVEYVLKSQTELSAFEPLECRTRFYDYDRDRGELVEQVDERRPCEYYDANKDRILVPFGAHFWCERASLLRRKLQKAQMCEDPSERTRGEHRVCRDLQSMTVVQDIYGVQRTTREPRCFLTILWRFDQTRTPNAPGRMTWRVVNFASPAPAVPQLWTRNEEMDANKDLRVVLSSPTASSANSVYPSLHMDLPHQSFAQHPPQLDLDSLSTIALEGIGDYSHPNSATTHSMSTDYSQSQSVPSLTHSQETLVQHSQDFHDANEIDFNGGQINLQILEPAISFGTYENYTHNPVTSLQPFDPLNPISGLEHTTHAGSFGDLGLGVPMSGCYPSKQWHYNDLIPRLGDVTGQSNGLSMEQTTCGQDENIVGHGVLHDGQLGQGLWKLQSAFGSGVAEDTGVGALSNRKDSVSGAHAHGSELLELMRAGRHQAKFGGY